MATVTAGRGADAVPPLSDENAIYERIYHNPKFQDLVRRRSSFAWTLAIVMLVVYYGFVLLVAFGKAFLATKVGTGVMTLGIFIALGVIIIAFVLTAIYVARANGEFDNMSNELRDEVMR